MLGDEAKVQTLYGDVKMKIDSGSQHNDKKKITNYGV
jgi:DnaJ-class molecular chaperone